MSTLSATGPRENRPTSEVKVNLEMEESALDQSQHYNKKKKRKFTSKICDDFTREDRNLEEELRRLKPLE